MTSSVHDKPQRMVPVDRLLDEFEREELRLKLAKDFQQSGWVRSAIVRILRIADQGASSIDPSEPST